MTATRHAQETLADLVAELHHADTLITEQAERIDALEAEVVRLRGTLAEALGSAA